MNRIAAKIAQKIAVFFEDGDIDAGAREQQAQHHARGFAAGDGTCGGETGFQRDGAVDGRTWGNVSRRRYNVEASPSHLRSARLSRRYLNWRCSCTAPD